MRFWRFPLLALATVLVISGCGQEAKQATPAKAPAGFRETGTADKAAPLAAESAQAPPMRGAFFEGDAAVPSADVETATTEPARSANPADAPVAREEATPEPEPDQFRQQIQAGTLTAGSLNDHQNLADYQDYVSQAQQSGIARNMRAFSLGERVMIEVIDAQGNGVPDVQVTITALGQIQDNDEGVLLDTTTRADGKSFFSSGLDGRSQGETFELTVRLPQGQAITRQVSVSQSPWVVELADVTRELPQQLDLALVIDTTQSMADELNYLKLELDNIVSTVHRMFPNVEQRYSLIVYRDEGDEYVVRNAIDFTSSLPDFRAKLAAQTAKGGGDIPEAMHLALENAGKLSWRRENTARVMFLVADAPPHQQFLERTMTAVQNLRQKGVAVYPLAGSGPMVECEFVMRAAAFLTRGQYLFLTDHSGVGNPHAKPTAPKYEVEPLNQLMIRMIASELAGKPVLAHEIIATEQGDGSQPPAIPQEQDQSAIEHEAQSYHIASTQPAEIGFCGTEDRAPLWETAWFRIVAAVVLISGILMLDNRLRM